MDSTKRKAIQEVIAKASNVYVSSIDDSGFPNIKAMFARMQDGPVFHYMSTNYSSKRTQQFLKNSKCSIYYCNEQEYKGVMLTGHIEVCTDHDTRALIWKDTDLVYYPQGVDDPDYCVYRFVAEKGNYYHGLVNIDFEISELNDEGGSLYE